MAYVFRPAYTRLLPPGAELYERRGERFARWVGRRGRKRTGRVIAGPDGTLRVAAQAETYSARYRDHVGRLRTVSTGCRDRDAALAVLAELQRRVELVRAGVLSAPEVTAAEHQGAPLAGHVEAYLRYLAGKRGKGARSHVAPRHVANVRACLKRVIAECRFTRLSDIDREVLARWAADATLRGAAARTVNAHLAALVAFGNWAVSTGRLAVNPLTRLPKYDERADQRRPRRALTPDELARLLTAARWRPLAEYGRPIARKAEATERPDPRSRATWNRAPLTLAELPAAVDRARARLRPDVAERLDQLGRERALLYKLLVLTGLRRGEAASLTIASVDLDGRVPCIRLRAADAKSGQAAELPLRADLAADLRSWLSERLAAARAAARPKQLPLPARLPDDAKLFNVPPNLSAIFNRDLRLAGIPKRDDRGRTVDVHALRHTFASLLSRGGVPPRTAQAALRHSTIELTMQTYTDPRLLDVAGALDVLPALPLDGRPGAERMRATGTDDAANRTDASADSLVLNLALAIDRNRARLAQTDQVNKIGDLSAVLGSDAAVTSCAKGAENSTKRAMGFEPTTSSLGSWHSTTELRPRPRSTAGEDYRALRLARQVSCRVPRVRRPVVQPAIRRAPVVSPHAR